MISPPEYQRMERWVQRTRERTRMEYRRAHQLPAPIPAPRLPAPRPFVVAPLWLSHPFPLESWLARVQWLGQRAYSLSQFVFEWSVRHTSTGTVIAPRTRPLRLPPAKAI
jgi:hypothetical protein